MVESNGEGLVQFLYILGRDEMPLGKVRRVIRDHVTPMSGFPPDYSDPDLEAWARARASEILVSGV